VSATQPPRDSSRVEMTDQQSAEVEALVERVRFGITAAPAEEALDALAQRIETLEANEKDWSDQARRYCEQIQTLTRERDAAMKIADARQTLARKGNGWRKQRDRLLEVVRSLRFCPECKHAMENHPTACELGRFLKGLA
jgi:NADH pyrophosphatase NudC (nudix superfamily)